MSTIKKNTLSEVAVAINSTVEKAAALYVSGSGLVKEALICSKEAGELLIQVKAALPHGEFISWIEANCKFTRFHASRLMNIARNWEKIISALEDKCDTRDTFAPLISLRTALALAATEPKEVIPLQARPTHYKVAQPGHSSYGEVVEVIKELHNGDVVVCNTPRGEFPFLKAELIAQDAPLEEIDAEIVEPEHERDKSEHLKEALALAIEYFPESVLKALLSQALFIGREYLPDSAKSSASKLLNSGNENLGILSLT